MPSRRSIYRFTLASVLALSFALAASGPVLGAADCTAPQAVTLVNPTILGNGSPGSVSRAQIQAALDAGGHIRFNVGAAPVTITLDQELVATRNTVIDGGGNVILSGGNAVRVMRMAGVVSAANAYTLRLQNITLRSGRSTGYAGDEFAQSGGNLLARSGGDSQWQVNSLYAVNTTFLNGRSVAVAQDGGGGGAYLLGLDTFGCNGCRFEGNWGSNGGGLYTLGTQRVSLINSQFLSNRATGSGGNPGSGGNGGAIAIDGGERIVDLCDTRIEGNEANAHAAGLFTVGYDALSPTRFERVSVIDNTALSAERHTGGLYLQGIPFEISQSTISGNSASGNGGIFLGPDATGEIVNSTIHANIARTSLSGGLGVGTSLPVTLRFVTVADNVAECDVCFNAGINVGAGNQLSIFDSILSNNTAPLHPWNPWNISRTVAGARVTQWPQIRPVSGQSEPAAVAGANFIDPLLAALGNNGGPTLTMALLPDSPAIGAAGASPPFDQRGVSRDASPDRGAFEWVNETIFVDGFQP